jgi:ADP-L-glycero-D-manno-heptose 6-epimerase
MNVLITGHKGFIGQNMVKLFDVPENNVFVWDWGDNGFPSVKEIDWCIHLGAISSTAETDVEKVMNQNYDFSRWILNECNKHNVNFQFASSASVYGLTSTFAEDAPVSPQSPYAWSKYLFERYAMKISQGWTIRIQGFRYFNVYGPHEDHKDQPSPYAAFERQAKETGVIKLFEGSEHFERDFVPVETVCSVHKKFMDVNKNGIWNVGTGQPTSFASIAKTVANKTGARIEYIPMPDHLVKQYQKYTCADLTNIRQEIDI